MSIFRLLFAVIVAVALAGCASGPVEDAGEVNRNDLIQDILQGFKEVGINEGDDRVTIGPGVDQVLNSANAVALRQRDSMEAYRVQRQEFLDVARFEEVHGPFGSDEFMAAVREHDAAGPAEPMMPKVEEYAAAQSSIYDANADLAAELASIGVEVATLVSQNSDEVAKAAGAGALGGLMSGSSDPNADLGMALVRARGQIEQANRASELIETEKATIKEILEMQADLDAR